MRYRSLFAILIIAWLVAAPAMRSQTIWHVTHYDYYDSTGLHNYKKSVQYHMSAISCHGQVCTAAGIVDGDRAPYNWLVFLRSTDGGVTWSDQVPKNYLGQFWLGHNFILKIEQIDSLHAVAIANDSGILIRTNDGGDTWERMKLPIPCRPTNFDFLDTETGIVTAVLPQSILTTSDGGTHWSAFDAKLAAFPSDCHAYTREHFGVWANFYGPYYETLNNWQTYDSTSKIEYDSSGPIIDNCIFGAGDTIIGYGGHTVRNDTGMLSQIYGSIVRTTNRGVSWERFPIADSIDAIWTMTGLDHDTLYAGGSRRMTGVYGPVSILRSTDRGSSWSVDTILLDTEYHVETTPGLAMTGDGHPIALFSPEEIAGGLPSNYAATAIFRGEPMVHASVKLNPAFLNNIVVPNPATDYITVRLSDAEHPIHVLDVLGREYESPHNGNTLDISRLPAGVYYLSDGTRRARFVKE